ncbi:trans-1,2-dihydrobenzene-1,2-diol dehydrogenase isoform X2 [Parasteatoda tepidariorum]|nr:trans-1,2-dihydrobenzene-1,2-diol dehydrogenase [Parasteatoda tepidariorum]
MTTKWGIVSAGKISHDFVAAVRGSNDGEHEFVAVAARSLESAEAFAKVHGIPKAYGSYESIANDPNVEVAYIGSITSQHFSLAKLMLENRKHVLLEKPMTTNLKETKTLCELAKKNKLFLMEALWSRFLPSYHFLMDLVRKDTIGKIVHVDAHLGVAMLDRERIVKKAYGGGAILDIGIYPLALVSLIYGGEKPMRIAAVGHLNEDGIDIGATCSLQFSNNRTASITTSAIASLQNDATIIGTHGQIKIPNPMYVATEIHTEEENFSFSLPEPIIPPNYPNSTGLMYEAYEVRRCLKEGLLESSKMPHKDSELLAEIMDEIRKEIGAGK